MRHATILLCSALLGLAGTLLPAQAGAEVDSGTVAAACLSGAESGASRRPAGVALADTPSLGVVTTEVRWTRWTTRMTFGEGAVLEGQVVTDDGAITDVTVDLYARQAGATDWRPVASATSGEDGVFAFTCLHPERTTRYRAEYEGDVVHTASAAEKRVAVMRLVPDTLREADRGGYVYRGRVRPDYAGGRVLLQTKTCKRCRWSTADTDTTSSTSRWRFRVSGPTSSRSVSYRAVVPAGDGFVRSYSEHVWRLTSR